jgi:hypothetical protein
MAMVVMVKSWGKEILGGLSTFLKGVGLPLMGSAKANFYAFTMCCLMVLNFFLECFEAAMGKRRRERAR